MSERLTEDQVIKQVVNWAKQKRRTRSEASSRWGHYFDEAIYSGKLELGEPEVVMVGRFRDLRQWILVPSAPSKP